MVSWFALVQFEKPLENSKSRIWTASLANPTPHKETGGPDPFRRVPRVVYITKAMSEKHCCTANCGKCNPKVPVANDRWPHNRLQEAHRGTAGQRHGVPAPIGAGK